MWGQEVYVSAGFLSGAARHVVVNCLYHGEFSRVKLYRTDR